MGDRKAPTPPPGDPGYTGPPQRRPDLPPPPPAKRFDPISLALEVQRDCDVALSRLTIAKELLRYNATDPEPWIDEAIAILRRAIAK